MQSDQLRPSFITQLDVSMSDISFYGIIYGKEKEKKFMTTRLEVFPAVFAGSEHKITAMESDSTFLVIIGSGA